jgi:TolB-like protein
MKSSIRRALRKTGFAAALAISGLVLLAGGHPAFSAAMEKGAALAILDFENATGSASHDPLVKAMTDTILTALVKSERVQVVERSKGKALLEEQQLTLTGLMDTGKMSYVGKMLAADQMVAGTLSRVEKEWIGNIRLLDVKTGRILMAEMFEEKEVSGILPATRKAGELLLQAIQRGRKESYRLSFLARPAGGGRERMASDEEIKLLETLRKKVEGYGGSVRRSSCREGKVEMDVEGITDPLELARALTKNDILEFRLVADERDPSPRTLPAGYEWKREGKDGVERLIAVSGKALLTGENIAGASIAVDPMNIPTIVIQFDSQGTSRFAAITRENIGKRVAILLNGEVLSAPVIRGEIGGGKAQISGNFTLDEAFQLSVNLKSGTLPVSLSLAGLEKLGTSP